ncbi:hypothetical protein NMY22_g19619 [Coprinellus aureogranulatus]|nr:hypothetical protein NMY22_g19619 [Coprinellus aureogranulatus]
MGSVTSAGTGTGVEEKRRESVDVIVIGRCWVAVRSATEVTLPSVQTDVDLLPWMLAARNIQGRLEASGLAQASIAPAEMDLRRTQRLGSLVPAPNTPLPNIRASTPGSNTPVYTDLPQPSSTQQPHSQPLRLLFSRLIQPPPLLPLCRASPSRPHPRFCPRSTPPLPSPQDAFSGRTARSATSKQSELRFQNSPTWNVQEQGRMGCSLSCSDLRSTTLPLAVPAPIARAFATVPSHHHRPKTRFQVEARATPTSNLQHFTKVLDSKRVERVIAIPLETNADYWCEYFF